MTAKSKQRWVWKGSESGDMLFRELLIGNYFRFPKDYVPLMKISTWEYLDRNAGVVEEIVEDAEVIELTEYFADDDEIIFKDVE